MRISSLVALLLIAPLHAQEPPDVQQVRAARTISNQAIIARDLKAYTATITPDFLITTGAGLVYTHDSFLTLWAKQFADSNWKGCLRTTDKVEIDSLSTTAAEHGHFTCSIQQSDGLETYTGTYLAMWKLDSAAWKTRSELFVTLHCTGSTACPTPKHQ